MNGDILTEDNPQKAIGSIYETDWGIVHGQSLGHIRLGMEDFVVRNILGKPDQKNASTDHLTYTSASSGNYITVGLTDSKVAYIQFTSDSFRLNSTINFYYMNAISTRIVRNAVVPEMTLLISACRSLRDVVQSF